MDGWPYGCWLVGWRVGWMVGWLCGRERNEIVVGRVRESDVMRAGAVLGESRSTVCDVCHLVNDASLSCQVPFAAVAKG